MNEKAFVLIYLALVLLLKEGFAAQDIYSQTTPARKKLEILDESGKPLGSLYESKDGMTLVLLQANGTKMDIGSCSDEVLLKSKSPTGNVEAVVYVRNCGATVDYATHIALVRSSDTEGRVEKDIIAIFQGLPHVEVRWESDKKLVVRHSQLNESDIFRKKSGSSSVSIEYDATNEKVGDTQYLDFANFNYGATGLAAKMPRELLLRIAGWSQMESGLYKPAWGVWNGEAPYGDDPRGRAKIKEGMHYYQNKYDNK